MVWFIFILQNVRSLNDLCWHSVWLWNTGGFIVIGPSIPRIMHLGLPRMYDLRTAQIILPDSYLLFESKQPLNHFELLFDLFIGKSFALLNPPASVNALIKLTFQFSCDVAHLFSVTEPEGLPEKCVSPQLRDGLGCLIFIGADNESLTAHLYVLLCMHFYHVNADVAEKLEQRVFEVRDPDFFI